MAFICQLDNKNGRVPEHGNFPQGFDFARATIARRAHLGDAIHDVGNFLTQRSWEKVADFLKTLALVFNGVMQQCRNGPGFLVNQLIYKSAHPGRVRGKIRFPRKACLTGVDLFTPLVSLLNGFRPGNKRTHVKLVRNARTDFVDTLNFNHGPDNLSSIQIKMLSFYYSLFDIISD